MAAPVSLRLSEEKWRMYSDQAQAAGLGLSTYLKRRLEHGDEIAEQLAAIRRMIQATAIAQTSAPDGVLIEILLLMRSVVGEAKLGVVHGELKRQKMDIWTGANK